MEPEPVSWNLTPITKMFGIIVSGRLVETNFQQVGATQFLTTILDADNINHIVVFLTGSEPFPMGSGGLVYFSWPDINAPPSWQLLGHLSNEKPSAIFKVNNLHKTFGGSDKPFGSSDGETMGSWLPLGHQKISHNAQIGISVEPIMSVQAQAEVVEKQKIDSFIQFCRKMLENFLNYASSFGITQSQMTPNPNETYVPLSTLQGWYNNFERRLQLNPYFWQS